MGARVGCGSSFGVKVYLEYTVHLEPFFLSTPARRTFDRAKCEVLWDYSDCIYAFLAMGSDFSKFFLTLFHSILSFSSRIVYETNFSF